MANNSIYVFTSLMVKLLNFVHVDNFFNLEILLILKLEYIIHTNRSIECMFVPTSNLRYYIIDLCSLASIFQNYGFVNYILIKINFLMFILIKSFISKL